MVPGEDLKKWGMKSEILKEFPNKSKKLENFSAL